MTANDRSEAHLVIGELQIEENQPSEARISFYQALSGPQSASEVARAKKGIGLSYFLSSQPSLGKKHLEASLGGLDKVSKAEANYLLAAVNGTSLVSANESVTKRMDVFVVAAGLRSPKLGNGYKGGPVSFDISRSQWHAASMRSNWDKMTSPFRITVHHTAEPFSSLSAAAAGAEVKNIQDQHMNERTPGWADIGYHFLIDPAGNIIEGRPLYAQGAHASGSNNIGNIGICLLGNFVSQPDRGADYLHAQQPSASQLSSLSQLIDNLRGHYSIERSSVFGHKELKSTACPGPTLSRWVANYRQGRS
jgi:hypothetical protein